MSAEARREVLDWLQANRPELVADVIRGMIEGTPPTRTSAAPTRLKVKELYLLWLEDHGRKKKSYRKDEARSIPVLGYFGELYTDEVTKKEIGKFEEKRKGQKTRYGTPPAQATINREIMLLMAPLSWGERQRPKLCENMARGYEMADEDNIKSGRVTDAILEKIKPHMTPMGWAIVLVLYDSGMREMEGCTLKWTQFDHKTGRTSLLRTQVKARRGKGKARVPRLSKRALEAVLALPRLPKSEHVFTNMDTRNRKYGQRIGERWLYRQLELACERAGVTDTDDKKITFHTLRHSFAYRARVEWGWSERTIREVMGHKTAAAAERYGIVDTEEVDAAFDERDRIMAEEEARDRLAVAEEQGVIVPRTTKPRTGPKSKPSKNAESDDADVSERTD